MRQKDFLYWALNDQGEPLVGDLYSGQVITGSKDTLLAPDGSIAFMKRTPDGWKDVLVKYGRNNRYFGLFRDFTVQMKFYRDAALVMRSLYWNKGVEAYCKLLIHKNDRSAWPDKYKTWYTGEIDFSKFRQGKISEVTASVMEGGVAKYLKANENTVYEIEVDLDHEHVNVLHDGVMLIGKQTYIMGAIIYSSDYFLRGIMSAPKLSVEGQSTGILCNDSDVEDAPNIFTYMTTSPTNQNCFAEADENNTAPIDIKVGVNFKLKLKVEKDQHFVYIAIIKQPFGGGSPTFYDIFDTNATPPFDPPFTFEGEIRNIVVNHTIPADPGDKLFLYMIIDQGTGFGDPSDWEILDEGTLTVEFRNRYPATIIKGLYFSRLLEKVVAKVTEGKYGSKSDWLAGMKDFVVTSGDNIRGITTLYDSNGDVVRKGGRIKTSLSELFQVLFARFSAGLGIEDDKVAVEQLPYFFQEGLVLDLGNVDDCEFYPAEDLMINSIKAGYAKQEYNDVNGKSEFNQGQKYTTPITRIVKEMDLSSAYRADPFGIEFLRINLDGKTTTDDSGDSDTFILNIEDKANTTPDGLTYYKLNRPAYDTLEGVADPDTIYNVELSPKRGVLNNGRLLRSLMHLQDAGFIKFASADMNSELKTVEAGITILEKDPVEIAELGEHLFLPHYATFSTSVPFNLQELMRTDPYKEIAFTWEGTQWKGYLWDGGIKPATNDKQTWKVLLSKNNDVTKLIDV